MTQRLPLVAAQPGIWMAEKLSTLPSAWSVAHYVELTGELDALLLAKAVVAGLEQALRNIETHCTDAGLLEEQQEKVAKQKQEVEERLADLQSARVSGKPDKIAKKQAKLEESQAELLEAQRELEALQKLVKP